MLDVYISLFIGPLAPIKSGKVSTTCLENYFRNIGDMLFEGVFDKFGVGNSSLGE
jgi:hypothetical protein